MKLFIWKNNRKIDAFAFAIANELYSYVQPDEAKEFIQGMPKEKRKDHRRIEKKLEAVISDMRQFMDEESLGIYGKARLQKKFSDRLVELGYDSAVTRKLVEIILLRGLARN